MFSPVRSVQTTLQPIIQASAGNLLVGVTPSGPFAKGTANKSGTDIDLFISLSHNTTETIKEVYERLLKTMSQNGYNPKRQNVSINVNGYNADLVPGRRQDAYSQDHSLHRREVDSWTKTKVAMHIAHVPTGGRIDETRIIKLWRNQKGPDFLSFYLETTRSTPCQGRFLEPAFGNFTWALPQFWCRASAGDGLEHYD